MSQPMEHNEKTFPEPKREHVVPFSWGVRRGSINLYESFTLEGVKYSLYDTVCLRRNDQIDIGKLIRILEIDNREKRVEVVWFFKPRDIASFLGDVKPLERELFLACGEGRGLSNINPLEAIMGKCDMVCSSKDQRNPQPTEKELGSADFLFYRTFDVGRRKVLENFPSSIAGIKVDHFLNRRSSQTLGDGSECKEPLKAESPKCDFRLDARGYTSSTSSRQIKSSITDRPLARDNIKRSVQFLPASPSDIGPTKKRKLLPSSGNRSGDALFNPPTTASGEENHVKLSCIENTDLSAKKSSYLETREFTGKGLVNKQHVGTCVSHKFTEVRNQTVDALPNPPTTASGEEKHVKLSCTENTDLSARKSSYLEIREFTGKGPVNEKHVGTVISQKFSVVRNRTDDALSNPPTTASREDKKVKLSFRKNTDLSGRKSSYSKTREFTGKGPINKQVSMGISHKFSEVTRKPGMDTSKWLKLEVWAEERLNEANAKGTILVLENLDPSFAASEVEDIVWHVFRENVKAKMVPTTAFSSVRSGQALVMFKTKEAADKVMSELLNGCLVLGDGRPIIGRRRFIRKVAAAERFVGHLSVDRGRAYKQRKETRDAVATSHFSQNNTVEFEMAILWRELDEKSRRWWAALHEQQGKEIEPLMNRLKIQNM
ncbi:protein ANTI-SILENCING 1-like [Salvia splendens]|uniref:protein ANTI-SILENCING 1-like n=1 Tax=Salvia splendens TaxID=180675 RepID=UPI001C2570D3|nr:protein ANTI-SILENCING 1-like [Salvia splendens]XP_042028974.1 protein ANTI-SILENCING 1-like [Salvia splendens]